MVTLAQFGAGRIGQIHAGNIVLNGRCRLKAIVDVHAEAAAALADKTNARVMTGDRVFADPEIDGVVIASATNTHADLIEAAARAGKAIFCEKPIDLDSERVAACLKVVAAVEEQYLSTDILQEGVMERPVLPPNLETLRLSHFQKVFML